MTESVFGGTLKPFFDSIDPEEKFLPFTFRPETGPTIRTFALCLVLHYENALPLRISARIGSSN